MKIKTATLTDAALNWAVALAEGHKPPLLRVLRGNVALPDIEDPMSCDYLGDDDQWARFDPSTNWAQGGPIIERKRISTRTYAREGHSWVAFIDFGGSSVSGVKARQTGPTALTAAMRCHVASELGDEVDVPEELL